MRDKDYYEQDAFWELPAFGIAAFSVPEAAAFVAGILCLEGNLEKHLPDEEEQYCLDNPILPSLLKNEIEEFQKAIISGIENGTLKTLYTSRNIHDRIQGKQTYIDIEVLHNWFSARGIDISGDVFAEYTDKVCEIYDAAIDAIVTKEDKIRRGIKDDGASPYKQKIYLLERKISELQKELSKKNIEEKPLATRERETVLKIIIGMAVKGYAYEPKKTKNSTANEIASDLTLLNIPVSGVWNPAASAARIMVCGVYLYPKVKKVDTLKELLDKSDVLVTNSRAQKPYISSKDLRDDAYLIVNISLMDFFLDVLTESDHLIVDDWHQNTLAKKVFREGVDSGVITRDKVEEFGEVLFGLTQHKGRIFINPLGMGMEDVYVASQINRLLPDMAS